MTAPQFANLPCGVIVASRTNRKHFDPAAMAELAADIKLRGVLSPILVRPLPASRLADTFENRAKGDPLPTHEIIFGERRWRASNVNNAPTIPVQIVDMTDAQALEAQLIENLQREDLTALDEANGIEQLMASTCMSIDDVAAKLSKSRRHVYNRLALLELAIAPAIALRKGEIDSSRALLIAGIPNEGQQIKALAWATEEEWDGSLPSVRVLQQHIRQTYMLRIDGAKFDTDSVTLLPAAGACAACPKRTGAKPDLFAGDHDEDLCIDSVCYHAKEAAHSEVVMAEAQAKGQTVITGKAAQELLTDGYNAKFKGYRRLDDAEDSPTDKPLRKIIGKQMEAEGITPVMIEHPKKPGELVAVLSNEVALRLLKTVEGQAEAAKTVSKEVREFASAKKKKADDKAQAKFEQGWRDELVARVWASAPGNLFFVTDMHRYTALRSAHSLSTEHAAKICKVLGLGAVAPVQAVIEEVKSTSHPDQLHMLIIMVRDADANEYRYNADEQNEGMHLVAKIAFATELPNVISDIKAECVEKYLPALKPAKRTETTSTPGPAAQQSGLAHADAKPPKKPAPLRKARLSAQEAKSGIAAALQGIGAAADAAESTTAETPGQIDGARPQLKQANTAAQGALSVGFVVGQRVKVVTDTDKLGRFAIKHAGKVGTITKQEPGGGFWDVTFRGRNGGVCLLAEDQIEVAV